MNTPIFDKLGFCVFTITGNDADQFLQGQLTINTQKVGDTFLPCAICNLKGRVAFGLWIKRVSDGFLLVMVSDLADSFKTHIKKYGAFSKIHLSDPTPIYACVIDNMPSFCFDQTQEHLDNWQTLSIQTANAWISQKTAGLFAPQELRLHQRGGVDYNKGCYLGQEIVARLWFKSAPKAFLHRINTQHDWINGDLGDNIVNRFGDEALVIARPNALDGVQILAIDGLTGEFARNTGQV